MPSLRDLQAAHGPLLLLDAASAVIHAGWLERTKAPRWVAVEEEAGAGVFRALEQLEADVGAAGSFVLCEGPGSILGIRTSAAAVRIWHGFQPRPLYTYRSLELLAHVRAEPGLTLIADARKQSWHALTLDAAGRPGPIRRIEAPLLRPPLATPAGFRHWSPLPPAAVVVVPYDVPALWQRAEAADLLRATSRPDAFLHEEPRYATWTPRIHRPETAS